MTKRDTQIAERVAAESNVNVADVEAFFVAVRDVVDDLVSDHYAVIAWPLMSAWWNDPVFERVRFMIADPSFELPNGFDSPPGELADRFRLPLGAIDEYPIVGEGGVLCRVGDLLALSDEQIGRRFGWFEAWAGQYVDTKGALPYRPRPIGLVIRLRVVAE